MPTLIHVKAALHLQDIDHAKELLKDVLRHDPCEHSYYLAARLAVSPSQKIKYLKKALAHNPEHTASQKFLKHVQSEYQPLLHRIWSSFLNIPMVQTLRHKHQQLTFREHLAFMGGSVCVTVATFGLILLALFGSTEIYLPEVNAFSYVQVNNTDTLFNHFESNSLDVTWMELQPIPGGIHSGQYIKFSIAASGTDYIGQMLIYESYSAVAKDIRNIKAFGGEQSISANKNTILIYAPDLPATIEAHLVDAYRTMPTIEIDPR